jgi:peptidoglycan/xylan/chitin deacetylase (PgdA/CDA1 family)
MRLLAVWSWISDRSSPPARRRAAHAPRPAALAAAAAVAAAAFLATGAVAADPDEARPLLVTVDDLPISAGRLHPSPEDRAAITRGMLEALERHGIRAVGLVTWGNVRGPEDLELLEMWLDAGHELGNHSWAHLDYGSVSIDEYVADAERARSELAAFLEPRGKQPRFYRFPMLREGETPAKLAAMRDYLDRSLQRNLPVTIDNQDWSFEEPWVRAVNADDTGAMKDVAEDYHAAMRLSVRHHERTGDALYGRKLPQILLLHAGAVGAAQWDRLFDWLEKTGHRFAGADEVLADPVFDETHGYVGPRGLSLWDRLAESRRHEEAQEEVETLLDVQAAAWNRGDLEAFCSVYADDAVFLSTTGLHVGRQGILERYRKRYADRAAMGTLSFQVLDFRPASGIDSSLLGDARPSGVHGAALAARWTLEYPDREDATGLTLLVLRRVGGGWQIVQDASM